MNGKGSARRPTLDRIAMPEHLEIVGMALSPEWRPFCCWRNDDGSRCMTQSQRWLVCDKHMTEDGAAALAVALNEYVKWYWGEATAKIVERMEAP